MQSVNDVSANNEGLESGNHSYTYDEIGNLSSDKDIESIQWTVYGKIAKVKKRDLTEIEYKYDGTGQRIYKKVATTTVTKETHYVRDGSGNVLAIYENKLLDELVIYGSSRLGSYNVKTDQGKRTLGNKKYELSNHLGNVLSVISDNKIGVDNVGSDLIADIYEPLVISESDYYPFGMAMKERSFSNEEYRFGFNGMEKDTDFGSEITDHGARLYNKAIARWFACDPLEAKYPSVSTFAFVANMPIRAIDPDGERIVIIGSKEEKQLILETLQKLTNDKLAINANNELIITKLGGMNKDVYLKNGTKLIRQMNQKKQSNQNSTYITISNGKGNQATPSSNTDKVGNHKVKGVGTDAIIDFDPMSDPLIMTVNPLIGLVEPQRRPNEIGLIHEVIHAKHINEGTVDNTYANHTYQTAQGEETEAVQIDELRTVGLNNVQEGDITENDIREEQWLNLRGAYQTKDKYLPQDEI